jgi:hypothetical protein
VGSTIPIDTLFAHVNRFRTFVLAGGEPMGDAFLTHSVENFHWSVPSLTHETAKHQTCVLFQEYFYEAHRELSKITASGGHHSANAIKEAARDDAFEKLAAETLALKAEVNKKTLNQYQ